MKMISEIEGFEKFTEYGITSCGRVWSYKRNKFLKPSRNKKGYLYIGLTYEKTSKLVAIHRLVGLAYIPNPDNLETIDHIDENKEHNYVNNLRWMSRGENKSRSWSKPVSVLKLVKSLNLLQSQQRKWASIKQTFQKFVVENIKQPAVFILNSSNLFFI